MRYLESINAVLKNHIILTAIVAISSSIITTYFTDYLRRQSNKAYLNDQVFIKTKHKIYAGLNKLFGIAFSKLATLGRSCTKDELLEYIRLNPSLQSDEIISQYIKSDDPTYKVKMLEAKPLLSEHEKNKAIQCAENALIEAKNFYLESVLYCSKEVDSLVKELTDCLNDLLLRKKHPDILTREKYVAANDSAEELLKSLVETLKKELRSVNHKTI
ncbi:MAG: hypothetical protein GY730_00825 [bacterium]|nr:hypothetical protein [bacterium]